MAIRAAEGAGFHQIKGSPDGAGQQSRHRFENGLKRTGEFQTKAEKGDGYKDFAPPKYANREDKETFSACKSIFSELCSITGDTQTIRALNEIGKNFTVINNVRNVFAHNLELVEKMNIKHPTAQVLQRIDCYLSMMNLMVDCLRDQPQDTFDKNELISLIKTTIQSIPNGKQSNNK